jgi:hypothetical protein
MLEGHGMLGQPRIDDVDALDEAQQRSSLEAHAGQGRVAHGPVALMVRPAMTVAETPSSVPLSSTPTRPPPSRRRPVAAVWLRTSVPASCAARSASSKGRPAIWAGESAASLSPSVERPGSMAAAAVRLMNRCRGIERRGDSRS